MPWIEWRISFPLVEKHIYFPHICLPHVFQKVFLLCKTLTFGLKKQYGWQSYTLKTTFLSMLKEWVKGGSIYKEDIILDMMTEVFSYMPKCYENKHLSMYFIPRINLLQQYNLSPETTHQNQSLKKHECVEFLEQKLNQLSDEISIINIIANFYETFDEIKEHQKWNNPYHLINDKRRMLCPQRSTFNPKCENNVLRFQLELYLRFLQIIYDSVLDDVAYCSQNLFCNLYYI